VRGNVLHAKEHFAAAGRVYGEALAVSQRLAESDPSNATWQRDLSVAFDSLADIQLAGET